MVTGHSQSGSLCKQSGDGRTRERERERAKESERNYPGVMIRPDIFPLCSETICSKDPLMSAHRRAADGERKASPF